MILAAAALSLSLHVQPAAIDMLDGTSIEVIAHNANARPVQVSFPSPNEYEIEILHGDDVIWTSLRPLPPGAHFPAHVRSLMPGPTVFTVYIWNGLSGDNTAPPPGQYTVRAHLLAGAKPEATATFRIINPAPVMAVAKLKEGDTVTLSGTLDASKSTLTDATGTIPLMKHLLTAPSTVAVRGFLTTAPGGVKTFYVQRWAPIAGATPTPKNSATPLSSPSPPVRRPL
ncbi:MAG TPA: hypothetical protein VFN49_10195 [Candidatus Aquilonibacter sp.]|nr:hypothetical protein [Candidatus Aquilonibacter sp.]